VLLNSGPRDATTDTEYCWVVPVPQVTPADVQVAVVSSLPAIGVTVRSVGAPDGGGATHLGARHHSHDVIL
jgi:hypothetical protein